MKKFELKIVKILDSIDFVVIFVLILIKRYILSLISNSYSGGVNLVDFD